MAGSVKTWVDNSPPSCAADDLNGFKDEGNNLIAGAGMALDDADHQQGHRAVAAYAMFGQYFIDGGAADAYSLTAPSPRVTADSAVGYVDGMVVWFIAANANTGASTVNFSGFGAKAIKNRAGLDLIAGDINTSSPTLLRYDAGNDWFVMDSAPVRVLAYLSASNQSVVTGVPTLIAFDGESFDSAGAHDNVTNNSRITVPAGFTKVRLFAQIFWANDSSGGRTADYLKNGASFAGAGGSGQAAAPSPRRTQSNIGTGWLPAVGGDYFEITVLQDSGGNLNLIGSGTADRTWFYAEFE